MQVNTKSEWSSLSIIVFAHQTWNRSQSIVGRLIIYQLYVTWINAEDLSNSYYILDE
jgi:hypothetical protein